MLAVAHLQFHCSGQWPTNSVGWFEMLNTTPSLNVSRPESVSMRETRFSRDKHLGIKGSTLLTRNEDIVYSCYICLVCDCIAEESTMGLRWYLVGGVKV
jgi:hypothetical protein